MGERQSLRSCPNIFSWTCKSFKGVHALLLQKNSKKKVRMIQKFSFDVSCYLRMPLACIITRSIKNGNAQILHYTSPISHLLVFLTPDPSEWSACFPLHARERDLRRRLLVSTRVLKLPLVSLTVKYVYLAKLHESKEVHSHWGRSWKQSQMPEVHWSDTVVVMNGLGWVVTIFSDMTSASVKNTDYSNCQNKTFAICKHLVQQAIIAQIVTRRIH